ncbi:dipeptidyl peptidase III, putative [Entamoeba invadens IP1]|uniref:Dipeptidyl peptidase 3 n=1 Tax=Entamoeba invadens IP1 TaxID=370355 RepID=A0A0A1UC27_ENTIV|nr:dipeptidyl peptidase III, putative [Entamoeba invadens IP1]ELP92790.1 dipeptidyl peptidase III, putative [Entamoeba invadens IP1]|eukprot:XP_004259561.1 dipeptidyl peptidase III, putative [Entamoeba invadens IP1]
MSLSVETPLNFLDCAKAWEQLTKEEKEYVYHLNKGNWATFLISVKQCSVEAFDIFVAFLKMYRTMNHTELLQASKSSENAKKGYSDYVASFFANGGNYLSFGDKKFIPSCTPEEFLEITKCSGLNLFEHLVDIIYNTSKELLHYGIPPEGCTTYYSPNMTKEEIEHLNTLLLKKGLLLENTRIDKIDDKIIVSIASTEERSEEYENITLRYGHYKEELKELVNELKACLSLPLVQNNSTKKNMFEEYIKSFSGDYTKHKEAQRWWVRDQKPSVEFNVGFIETYEDPIGTRGEWEMFVAVVDKLKTQELTELVKRAGEILPTFPWPKEFEKSVFESPDFTSIDIIGFGTSGLPIGINLPNYDDVRMEQFKNVSLSNVMSARNADEVIQFITPEQQEFYKKYSPRALETQVALHELLGHGSGRYLRCDKGVKNFPEDLLNPITHEKVKYYIDEQKYDSVFGGLGSSLEECRAETAGLYLTYDKTVGEILKLSDDEKYANWLSEMRSGIVGMKFYNPETKKWGQAHCQARFALYKTVEKSGAVKFEDGNVVLDRNMIGKGIEELKKLLLNIQVARATGDLKFAQDFFIPLSTPNEEDLKIRQIVIDRNIPRSGLVQCNIIKEGEEYKMKTYEPNVEGMIQSYLDRFNY